MRKFFFLTFVSFLFFTSVSQVDAARIYLGEGSKSFSYSGGSSSVNNLWVKFNTPVPNMHYDKLIIEFNGYASASGSFTLGFSQALGTEFIQSGPDANTNMDFLSGVTTTRTFSNLAYNQGLSQKPGIFVTDVVASYGTRSKVPYNVNYSMKVYYEDDTPPTVPALNNPNMWVPEYQFNLSGSTDDFKLANYFYRLNGGNWIETTGNINLSGLAGQYNLEAYATDSVGNKSPITSGTYYIDSSVPIPPSLVSPSSGWINHDFVSELNVNRSNPSDISSIIQTVNWVQVPNGFSVNISKEGINTLVLQSVSGAGVVSSGNVYTIKIDKTPPPKPVISIK